MDDDYIGRGWKRGLTGSRVGMAKVQGAEEGKEPVADARGSEC
jgi:hypothetical protein